MGVGDNIKKAAENAMEDLAGTTDPHDDGHVPEPGERDDDIQVHSSISEGSNAMDEADDYPLRQGAPAGGFTVPQDAPDARGSGASPEEPDSIRTDGSPMGNPGSPSGPAGLPGPDPEELRADPSEADEDPTSSMGRG